MTERFESIFEFKIRLLRPRPEKGEEINWVLKSLGVDDIGIKIILEGLIWRIYP